VGTSYTPAREVLSTFRSTTAPQSAPQSIKTTTPSWDDDVSAPTVPSATAVPRPVPPAAVRPPVVVSASSQVPRHTPSPAKPVEDRIGPVGTAYTPVSLPAPKKLVNPFEARQQTAATGASASRGPPFSGTKKLTWSERQALTRKQEAEEEAKSQAASVASVPTVTSSFGFTAAARIKVAQEEEKPWSDEERNLEPRFGSVPTTPPFPPPQPVVTEQEYELDVAPSPTLTPPPPTPPPPPPPPPPMGAPMAMSAASPLEELPPVEEPTGGEPAGRNVDGQGVLARVQFPYEATEINEMDLVVDEIIERIEQLDDGWWHGVGSGGAKSGLFPGTCC